MFRVALPVICALVAVAAPASAFEATDAAQPPAAKPVKEKKVCRTETGTGSIMPKRTCRTRAEWDALTQQSQDNLQRSRDVNRGTSMVAGNRGQ